MKTTQRILEALKITYWSYDYIRETFFIEWCKKYSIEHRISLRAMITHDGLRNWYQDQWLEDVEKKFAKNYGDFFGKADEIVLEKIMYEYADNLLEHYPGSLIAMIKNELKPLNNGIFIYERN